MTLDSLLSPEELEKHIKIDPDTREVYIDEEYQYRIFNQIKLQSTGEAAISLSESGGNFLKASAAIIKRNLSSIINMKTNTQRIEVNNLYNKKFAEKVIEVEESLLDIENAKRTVLDTFKIDVQEIIQEYATQYNQIR